MKDSGRQKGRQRWERKEWASLVEKHPCHVKASPWGRHARKADVLTVTPRVLVVLSCSTQLNPSAHLIESVLDAVDICGGVLFGYYTAKLSACRVFDTCLGTVVVMSFMWTRKRVGDTTPPRGTPSLNSTCLLIIPSTFTLTVPLKRKSLSHLNILPWTSARRSFSSGPSCKNFVEEL